MSEPESKIVTAAPHNPALASTQLASYLGIEKGMMIQTVKRQCFKGLNPDQVTDEQLASFISVASQFKVNVMLPGFLYCYPERNGGIQVMIGPDLMFKLLSEHPDIESWETLVYPEDVALPPTHAVTKIWRKGCERPVIYTAVLSEWRVQSNPNWVTRPRHMLSIRSLKQAARQLIHGLPFDEDERQIAEMQNVTPEPIVPRPAPPKRAAKGAASVAENPAPAGKGTVIDAETTPVPPTVPPGQSQAVAPSEAKAVTQAEDVPAGVHGDPHEVITSPAKPIPRAFLKDAEEITAVCEVVGADGMIITSKGVPSPSVQVKLKGGYEGVAYQIGGGAKEGEMVKPAPIWAAGNSVVVKLRGKLNTNPKVNRVQVFVDNVQAEEPAMEV